MTAGKKRPRIKSIYEKLIEKGLTSAQLIPQIPINSMIRDKKKYNFVMSQAVSILPKLVSD